MRFANCLFTSKYHKKDGGNYVFIFLYLARGCKNNKIYFKGVKIIFFWVAKHTLNGNCKLLHLQILPISLKCMCDGLYYEHGCWDHNSDPMIFNHIIDLNIKIYGWMV